MSTTLERLSAILVKEHGLPPDRLTPEATLDGLGIDSLGTVELLWNVEDAFGIKLPSEPVDLPTLADVVRYIDALVARQPLAPATTAPAALLAPTLPAS